jgi:hypothetical protein
VIEAASKTAHHLSMTQSEWVAKVFLALVFLAVIWVVWRGIKRALGGGSATSGRRSASGRRGSSYSSWR